MTKVIAVKGCDAEIEMSDSTFKPMRIKPTLAIRQDNEVIKIASFNNWNSALKFEEIMEKMLSQVSILARQQEQDFVERKCKELGIDYTQIYTCNSN